MFGLATLSCGAVGWLAGPVLGSSAFGVMNSKYMEQIAEVGCLYYYCFFVITACSLSVYSVSTNCVMGIQFLFFFSDLLHLYEPEMDIQFLFFFFSDLCLPH